MPNDSVADGRIADPTPARPTAAMTVKGPWSVDILIRGKLGAAAYATTSGCSYAEYEEALTTARRMAAAEQMEAALRGMLTISDVRCCRMYDEGHTDDCPFVVARVALAAAALPAKGAE